MSIQQAIKDYETACAESRGTSDDTKEARARIRQQLDARGLEFCAHNLAIFGSERYSREKNPTLDRAVTATEYRRERNNHWDEDEFDFQLVDCASWPKSSATAAP